MTVADHPAELQLLALVEGELSRGEERVLEEHVAACAACWAAVEAQRGARALLRAAPAVAPLLPQQVRDLVRALPAHPRPLSWWRGRPAVAWRPKPVFLLAPAGAVAAAVVLAVFLSSGPGRAPAPEVLGTPPAGALKAASAPTTATRAARATGAPKAGVATAATPADASPLVGRVGGPAAQVVAVLKARGIAARLEAGRVVVSRADGRRAREALAGRPAGPVEVVTR